MSRDRIIDRIRKMMRLRDNNAATQGEMEAASLLIQKLLFEHNLSMDEVSTENVDNPYERQFEEPAHQKKRESTWVIDLYNVIAKHNFCHIVVEGQYKNPKDRNHKTYKVAIIGKRENVEVVMYFCSWLVPKIRKMADEAFFSYNGYEKRGQFLRGYLVGCVAGINAQLVTQQHRMEQQSDASRALVLRRDIELQREVARYYPKTKTGRRSSLRSQDGSSQGYEDGRNLDLNKGIETRKRKLLG